MSKYESEASKFKVGDRVVVVANQSVDSPFDIGEVFVIDRIRTYPHEFYFPDGWSFGYLVEELEFEDVYNSPLYQALK